jgi:hypothetical protein
VAVLKSILGRGPAASPADEEGVERSRLVVLAGAVRRFVGLLGLAALVVLVVAAPVGLLLGADVARSIAVGFYIIGSFLLVAGFFIGNRGPVRLRGDETEIAPTAGLFGIGLAGRRLRWATMEENQDAMSSSAVFVALGFALIVIGVLADSRVELV